MVEILVPPYKRWKDIFWPLGGTVLGLIVLPVAIAQYPDFFNKNRWLLPSSIVVVILCWITPLLIHDNASRIWRWVWSCGVVGKVLAIISALVLVALGAVGGITLFRFHAKHLTVTLSPKVQPRPARDTPATTEEKIKVRPMLHHQPKPQISITKQVDELASQIEDWIQEKDKQAPRAISGPQVPERITFELESHQEEFWKQASKDFDKMFADRIISVRNRMKRCAVDTQKLDDLIQVGYKLNGGGMVGVIVKLRELAVSVADDNPCQY